mgnify:CR=1 FL=1
MCMHVAGFSPLMSAKVHPIASFWSFSTRISFSSSKVVSLQEIITGSVSPSPRNAYFRWLGNCFNSNFRACTIDGKSFECDYDNSTQGTSYLTGLRESNSKIVFCNSSEMSNFPLISWIYSRSRPRVRATFKASSSVSSKVCYIKELITSITKTEWDSLGYFTAS